jgi:hypothetical protein
MNKTEEDHSNILIRLESIYKENTLITVIILSLLTFFGTSLSLLFPFIASYVTIFYTGVFIPAFVIIICLEMLLTIRPGFKEMMKHRCENELVFESFDSRNSFEDHLEKRLKTAKDIKIINLSSQTSFRDDSSIHHKLLKKFVDDGKKIERITANTNSKEVFDWYKEDLKNYPSHKYSIHLLEKVFVNYDNRLINVLIIDDKEVYLGGWHKSRVEISTVSIIHKAIVDFFLEYYDGLKRMAVPLTLKNIDDIMKFPLEIISGIDNIYEESIKIINGYCKDSIFITGITPNKEPNNKSFEDALRKKLLEEKEKHNSFLSKNVISIRNKQQLAESIKNYNNFKDTKYFQKVVVGVPHFLDVFISDEKELLIGIPEAEGINGYTKCIHIRDKEAAKSISEWFKNYLWNESIELIGTNGIDEENVKEIERQLDILEQRK